MYRTLHQTTLSPIPTLPPPYTEDPSWDAPPQSPPPARSPPRSPPRRVTSALSPSLQAPLSASPSITPRSELQGPRPLLSRQNAPPRQPENSDFTGTQICSKDPSRALLPRAWPSRNASYRRPRRTGSSDLEADKWQAMEKWRTADTKNHLEWYQSRCLKHHLQRCSDWSWRKKLMVFGSVAGSVLLLIIVVVAGTTSRSSGGGDNDELSPIHVTNQEAFQTGGATHQSVTDFSVGADGKDQYHYYSGTSNNYPSPSAWVAYEDMWNRNLPVIKHSCTSLGNAPDNSKTDISIMYSAIQDTARATLVDHRFILATILQESHGCVSVSSTTSSGGVHNPGLMQSHNGTSYNPARPKYSIYKMIHDGTQGTPYGDGLVQNLNKYGNVYRAARGYNSGSIAPSGDLSDANGATACYVSDIANRLTGWVNAPSTCVGY